MYQFPDFRANEWITGHSTDYPTGYHWNAGERAWRLGTPQCVHMIISPSIHLLPLTCSNTIGSLSTRAVLYVSKPTLPMTRKPHKIDYSITNLFVVFVINTSGSLRCNIFTLLVFSFFFKKGQNQWLSAINFYVYSISLSSLKLEFIY